PRLAERDRLRMGCELPPEATPLELFRRLTPAEEPLFLDSAGGPEEIARFSFLAWGRAPTLSFPADPTGGRDPFAALGRAVARRPRREGGPFPPIVAIGWLGYDLGRCVERLPEPPREDQRLPALWFRFPRWIVGRDGRTGENALLVDGGGSLLRSACAEVEEVLRRPPRERRFRLLAPLRSDFTRAGYEAIVESAREWIASGEIFQVNLSQRFAGRFEGDALSLYERLRGANPSPFGACLVAGDAALLSSSPERFLRVEEGRVETRPIKGTRPRTGEPRADAEAAAELERDEKERAELTMIVDVERNDLSRVCEAGTVEVPRLAGTEAYARVFHRVATVTGTLRPGVGPAGLLRATFPSGSVTGAPKIRAMEAIAALERTGRGVYTGALGWIGGDGSLDLSVAIRILSARGDRLAYRVGGGIVHDSRAPAEYEETLVKGRAIEEALAP
ncbi:MAG: anthranilate synthase component I family protein, partial [Planctomycetota bacterium]